MQPDTPWFESDQLDGYLSRASLTPELTAFVRTMARDGGAVLDLGETGRRLCDRAAADAERYFANGKTYRVQDSWLRSRATRKLATLPSVTAALQAAYGRRPFPFQTLNFRAGSEQHLHSDAVHFSSLPERFMAGVWIALEDVEPDAGPVVYKPGSHSLPILKMQDVGVNSDTPTSDDYARHYVPRFAERMASLDTPETPALLKKGQAFVWAANLAHGGSPIRRPGATRRSLVVHFYFEDCAYYTPMMSNEAAGNLYYRLPLDAGTGLWRWPRVNGKPIRLSKHFALTTMLRRRVYVF